VKQENFMSGKFADTKPETKRNKIDQRPGSNEGEGSQTGASQYGEF
jgi:hypothetical protein